MAPDTSAVPRQLRPLALAATAVTGVLAGGFLGATTNAVNGLVSPLYFTTVLNWYGVANVWRAAVAQGAFEGLLYGVFFSLVFTTATGLITGAACPYRFALKHLLGILGGVYVCWALGGAAGVGLASLSPEFYRVTFGGVPTEYGWMLRYAWVGGSIWGAELGGLVCVVLGLVVLRASWKRLLAESAILPPIEDAPVCPSREIPHRVTSSPLESPARRSGGTVS